MQNLKSFICGIIATCILFFTASSFAEEELCPGCGLPTSVCQEVFPRATVDENTSEHTYLHKGGKYIPTEDLWNIMVSVNNSLPNVKSENADFYLWLLDEVVDTASEYGKNGMYAIAATEGKYGVTGIALSEALNTLERLADEQPDVYVTVMSYKAGSIETVEENLIINVPFNIAVALETLVLNCPDIDSNFSTVGIRANVYADVIRGGDDPAAVDDFYDTFYRRQAMTSSYDGEDWVVLEDILTEEEKQSIFQ